MLSDCFNDGFGGTARNMFILNNMLRYWSSYAFSVENSTRLIFVKDPRTRAMKGAEKIHIHTDSVS